MAIGQDGDADAERDFLGATGQEGQTRERLQKGNIGETNHCWLSLYGYVVFISQGLTMRSAAQTES